MQQPALIPLYGDRRVLFDATIMFVGFDFTGASARMQVRTAPDVSGTALLDISTGSGITIPYAGTDTVANHIAADRLTADQVPSGYDSTDNLTLSLVTLRRSASGMAFASVPSEEKGDAVTLAYDLLITPSGGDEDKYAYGPFILRGTVVQ